MSSAEIVGGWVKMRAVYKCRGCLVGEHGSTYEAQVTCLDDLISHVNHPALPASRMPVGWVSYTDGMLCPNCQNFMR